MYKKSDENKIIKNQQLKKCIFIKNHQKMKKYTLFGIKSTLL